MVYPFGTLKPPCGSREGRLLMAGRLSQSNELEALAIKLDDWEFRQLTPGSIEGLLSGKYRVKSWTILLEFDMQIFKDPKEYTGEFIGLCDSFNQQKRWINLLKFDIESIGYKFREQDDNTYLITGSHGIVGWVQKIGLSVDEYQKVGSKWRWNLT